MSSFYVTLPSNASLDVYPNNTLTDYHVELPVPIHLDGKYEVALHSMQYTRSWDNISEGDTKIKFSINDVKAKFNLEIGHYSDPEDLIEIINNTIIEVGTRQKIRLPLCSATVYLKLALFTSSSASSVFASHCCVTVSTCQTIGLTSQCSSGASQGSSLFKGTVLGHLI